MASAREKGKIARSEWPKIIERYNKGESIAQIGRDYGCTAPAIRYIIKRTGNLKDQTVGVAASGSVAAASHAKDHVWPEAIASDAPPKQSAGAAMDRERPIASALRRRVTGDIAGFLVALDQTVLDTSAETLAVLQDAADRLMRSTARVRLELERFAEAQERVGRGAKQGETSVATRPQRA